LDLRSSFIYVSFVIHCHRIELGVTWNAFPITLELRGKPPNTPAKVCFHCWIAGTDRNLKLAKFGIQIVVTSPQKKFKRIPPMVSEWLLKTNLILA